MSGIQIFRILLLWFLHNLGERLKSFNHFSEDCIHIRLCFSVNWEPVDPRGDRIGCSFTSDFCLLYPDRFKLQLPRDLQELAGVANVSTNLRNQTRNLIILPWRQVSCSQKGFAIYEIDMVENLMANVGILENMLNSCWIMPALNFLKLLVLASW